MQSNPNLAATAAERSAVRSAVRSAARSDLLYVSNSGNGTVTVYDDRTHSLVATLTGFQRPKGECVDSSGDVFITDRLAEDVVEYAHGGTAPIAVISDSGFQDYACSVDLTTGDLAVANSYQRDGNAGAIAIYSHASGSPQLYHIDRVPNPQTCAYDDRGDLLVASDYRREGKQFVAFAYLPKKHRRFIHLDLSIRGLQAGGTYNVQWDGRYWALLYDNNVLRFRILNDGHALMKGTVYLNANSEGESRFWIFNRELVAAQPSSVLYWKYPAGGNSIASITDGLEQPYGVAVSRASKH